MKTIALAILLGFVALTGLSGYVEKDGTCRKNGIYTNEEVTFKLPNGWGIDGIVGPYCTLGYEDGPKASGMNLVKIDITKVKGNISDINKDTAGKEIRAAVNEVYSSDKLTSLSIVETIQTPKGPAVHLAGLYESQQGKIGYIYLTQLVPGIMMITKYDHDIKNLHDWKDFIKENGKPLRLEPWHAYEAFSARVNKLIVAFLKQR